MAPFTLIVSEIMTHTSAEFGGWTIGIAQDPAERPAYQERAYPFHPWEADTLEIAQKIKGFFTHLGTTEGTTDNLSPGKKTHVYIFKN
jgi:hypothetical protein